MGATGTPGSGTPPLGSGVASLSESGPRSGGARRIHIGGITRTGGITRRTTSTLRHPLLFRSRRCTSSRRRLRRSRTGTTVQAPGPTTQAFRRVLRRGSRSRRDRSRREVGRRRACVDEERDDRRRAACAFPCTEHYPETWLNHRERPTCSGAPRLALYGGRGLAEHHGARWHHAAWVRRPLAPSRDGAAISRSQ